MLSSNDGTPGLKELIEALKRKVLKALHDLSAYIEKTMQQCSIHHTVRLVIVTMGTCYEACNPEIFTGALGHDPDT
jgi:predicted nucleic acid-binding protein